jgi:hypothetical protein
MRCPVSRICVTPGPAPRVAEQGYLKQLSIWRFAMCATAQAKDFDRDLEIIIPKIRRRAP